ncbi:MAG TPA: helix-hairpin-helix domain-containing protein, partial [Thermoanaerobaculia bacterium]
MRKSLHILTFALLLAMSTVAMADAEPGGSAAAAGVVNINTASASELALLPRVGEKGAQRIIDYRQEHGPFKKPADLMQVKGVGAKTFELMQPYLAVSGATTLSTKVKSPRKPRAKKS